MEIGLLQSASIEQRRVRSRRQGRYAAGCVLSVDLRRISLLYSMQLQYIL
jgi:hypothetical protein